MYSRRQYKVNVLFLIKQLFYVSVLCYELPLKTINGTISKRLLNGFKMGVERFLNGRKR